MTNHEGVASFELPGVPGLEVLDVTSAAMAPAVRAELFEEYAQWHRKYFPNHLYVIDDMREALEGQWPDPEVVVHLWIFRHEGRTHGFCITHTNLRRAIGMVHYVAFDEDYRHSLPRGWLVDLAHAWQHTGQIDCAEAGVDLLGTMGEVSDRQVRTWLPSGYRPIGVDYREPRYGPHWAQHGAPDYFPMNPILSLTEMGRRAHYADVAGAALRAFLVDAYQLPEDDPTVAATLAQAAELPPTQPL